MCRAALREAPQPVADHHGVEVQGELVDEVTLQQPTEQGTAAMDLAEDATQQALLAIWQDLPQLRDPARFDAWSHRLLVRACYAEGRKERRWAPNLRLLPADEPVADGLGSIVDRDQLEAGFRRLSLEHRAVVVLRHYLDLPTERVAELLGIPVGTVQSRLHHAMRGLRAALDADARSTAREAAR